MSTLTAPEGLEQFCKALADLYESATPRQGDDDFDWWYAFSDDVDVNVYVLDNHLRVTAYACKDGYTNTDCYLQVVDKKLKGPKK